MERWPLKGLADSGEHAAERLENRKGISMNARSRSEAIEALENLSFIIVVHLALVTFFSSHQAVRHWQSELDGFVSALRRYDKGKKRKHNFNKDLICDALLELLEDRKIQDDIEDFIASKGLPVDDLDFEAVKPLVVPFAESILME